MCSGIDVGCDWEEVWAPVDAAWCPVEEELKDGFDCVTCPLVEFHYQSDDPNERDILRCSINGRLIILYNSINDQYF